MEQERLLRISEVKHKTGLGRSTIYENVKKGIFPKPQKPSPGVSGWRESEINDLINGIWKSRDI